MSQPTKEPPLQDLSAEPSRLVVYMNTVDDFLGEVVWCLKHIPQHTNNRQSEHSIGYALAALVLPGRLLDRDRILASGYQLLPSTAPIPG
jgi:hypothetical protein